MGRDEFYTQLRIEAVFPGDGGNGIPLAALNGGKAIPLGSGIGDVLKHTPLRPGSVYPGEFLRIVHLKVRPALPGVYLQLHTARFDLQNRMLDLEP
jgi:hypothetical protein